MILNTYEDFIERVNQLGYMSFSNLLPGFPSLDRETRPEQWHTGDPETDPWQWKDRAANERKLAFGCLLGGHKGFISESLYPYFYAACHPRGAMEERWAEGAISYTEWQIWQIFCQNGEPDTGEIRRLMGVTKKQGANKVDNAMKELQRTFYITVSGNRRKLNRRGEPYGWAVNTYMKVTDWAPESWLAKADKISREEAVARILDVGISISNSVERKELARVLKLR